MWPSGLNAYGDRATLEADLTVTSLNGITPSTISLNTHNHDDKYALVDHTHDDKYSKLDHAHEYNDIKNGTLTPNGSFSMGMIQKVGTSFNHVGGFQ